MALVSRQPILWPKFYTTGMTEMKLKEAINQYIKYCLTGDVKSGYAFLKSINNPSKSIVKFTGKVENRFFRNKPYRRFKTDITWVRDVLSSYYDYYIETMAVRTDKKTAEMNLLKALKSLPFNASGSDIREVEASISQKFKSIGWNFLGGVTQPYFGPYIYEELEEKIYSVELPDGNRNLPVKLMRKFHSLSWLDYATFGLCGTGGWAKQDGLYCVVQKYDISSENFQVSYLKHEAQHYDDYFRFPFLSEGKQEILEYRAKLVELIYSSSDVLFKKFMKEARNDSHYPHLLASYQIEQGFREHLGSKSNDLTTIITDVQQICEVARRLYACNTDELKKGQCWGQKI